MKFLQTCTDCIINVANVEKIFISTQGFTYDHKKKYEDDIWDIKKKRFFSYIVISGQMDEFLDLSRAFEPEWEEHKEFTVEDANCLNIMAMEYILAEEDKIILYGMLSSHIWSQFIPDMKSRPIRHKG